MKKTNCFNLLSILILTALITSCTTTPNTTPLSPTTNPITNTVESIPTLEPTPLSLPGVEVVPLDTLGKNIPWLPMENTARPGVFIYLFNLSKPPFTNVLVRRAFAAAIDREAIARIARDSGEIDPRGATTFTPPETLGRDLFNEVGVGFHPADARKLLTDAGYTNLDNFPVITLMTNRGKDEVNVKIAEEMIRQWQIYLGVTVTLEIVKTAYFDRVKSDPTEMYWSGWAADYNDPDDFLLENFRTGSDYNYNKFSNLDFDSLVDQAAESNDPALRQDLYIQAERILCEQEVALIPIFHTTYNIP